ncbi:MAG TPA: hypothetical protein PK156_05570 [Polyangium sp.]|nr:hypothetical protein [Polyangium sp.]
MREFVLKYLGLVGFSGLAFLACGGGDGQDKPVPDFDVAPMLSECGGFVTGTTGAMIPEPDPATYCAAEKLLWNYDAPSKTLSFNNSRIQLNCCGDHSVAANLDGTTVVLTEIDAPKSSAGGARCKCNCVFDYAAQISPVENGPTAFRIVRNVTDADPPTQIVWEGSLDLAASSGEVTISTASADPWCTPPTP